MSTEQAILNQQYQNAIWDGHAADERFKAALETKRPLMPELSRRRMMFYCEPCAKKNEWPYEFYMNQSRGPCECCDKTAICVDVPSHALPEPKRRKRH